MTIERVERRLAAVLAADIAGYSRLMGADEVGTLTALKRLRREVVDPAIAEHKGRIVKTTGDGLLVEFASSFDAVTCAMEVQQKMADGRATEGIAFRIGINVGDIIIDGEDIFGDGVNVAARVENECLPGGVYLSGAAYDQVRGKTNFAFDDLGDKTLKNIERPVRVYSARVGANSTVSNERKPLPLPDKPSIAVLPFQNMSGDPEQEYFADGMVEDIITALSRFKSLFVIARNSSFTYKGKAVDIKQVGRELGVRYVLEGSVRKAGGRLRITGQLIEAATGAHLWADRFDGPLGDIFDLQDKITSSVVAAIGPHLEQAEIDRSERKPTESLDAIDLYYRALQALYRVSRDENEYALKLAQEAIALDPNFAGAYGVALACYVQRRNEAWISADDVSEGKRLAVRAVELGADDAFTLSLAAHFWGAVLKEAETSATMSDRALILNPNLPYAWRYRGWCSVYLGQHESALEQFNHAIRLNPLDPQIYYLESGLAVANFFLRRFEMALAWNTKSMAHQKKYSTALRYGVAIYAMLGRLDDCQIMLERLREGGADMTISKLKKWTALSRKEDLEFLFDAYRIAGVPE